MLLKASGRPKALFRPGPIILDRGDAPALPQPRPSSNAAPVWPAWAARSGVPAQAPFEKATVAACALAGAGLAVLLHGVRYARWFDDTARGRGRRIRESEANCFPLAAGDGRVALLATSGSTTIPSAGREAKSGRDPRERLDELLNAGRAAADDALQLVQETGSQALIERTLQAQRALLETAVELTQELPLPQVSLGFGSGRLSRSSIRTIAPIETVILPKLC